MSMIKSKNTKPEKLLRSLLFSNGYRFRLHDKKIPGKPDIIFKSKKKVIFVHGCFWHRHKGCKYSTMPKSNIDFWKVKFEQNINRDLKVQKEIKASNWNFMIIWECELKKLTTLPRKIIDFLCKD